MIVTVEMPGGSLAQVFVGAALDDTEVELGFAGGEGLVLIHPIPTAAGPAEGEVEAFFGIGMGAGPGGALVKQHGDVTAERGLDFHGGLRA